MLDGESLLSVSRAAAQFVAGPSARRMHPSTILRWIVRGCRTPDGRRVRLEALRVGGRWFTSTEALARFADALTPDFADLPPAPQSSAVHRRIVERAAAELNALGL